MRIHPRPSNALLLALILAAVAVLLPGDASASAVYTYDKLGRLTTVIYDNGMCVAYSYDQNGNRTSQTNTIAGPEESAVWGSGVWGCFNWTEN